MDRVVLYKAIIVDYLLYNGCLGFYLNVCIPLPIVIMIVFGPAANYRSNRTRTQRAEIRTQDLCTLLKIFFQIPLWCIISRWAPM